MKFFVAAFLVIACAHALPAPAPMLLDSSITVNQYGGVPSGGNVDVYSANPVAADVDTEIDSAMNNLNAQNAGKNDLGQTINNVAEIVKEPLGWALGTVGGLATGAIDGVEGALNGLATGGLGGALAGLTGGIAKGAATGFANALGGTMGSTVTV